MSFLLAGLRWLVTRLSVVLVLAALMNRARRAWGERNRSAADRRRREREVLPSLYDRHPGAVSAPRRRIGLQSVPLERIVGTLRRPSQNTADFRPLPHLRGANWQARWQRINRALSGLAVLPPVDLVQVGDEFYVEDGHNRVAAARLADALEIDADVTQLLVPGVAHAPSTAASTTTLLGADVVRQAGTGRHSRTAERPSSIDGLSRADLLRQADEER